MKHCKQILACSLLSVLLSTTVIAEELTVSTPGGTVTTGQTGVTVDILINEGSNTAGASFTVNYDTNKLEYDTVSSDFFGTFQAQGISPTSVTIDPGGPNEETFTQGLVDNPDAGAVMLAAAQAGNGAAGQQTLFRLSFNVKSNAIAGDTQISITQTTLTNADAGYTTATDIPYLVGIQGNSTDGYTYPEVPVTTTTPGTLSITADSDGDGIDDTWESTHFGNLTTATATSDYDQDGYTDKQESLNGGSYDPKVADAAGGTGYNGFTDDGWVMLDEENAQDIIEFRDGIVADFGTDGLYYFDGSTWTSLTSNDSLIMAEANVDGDSEMELIVFLDGLGLYTWDGSWTSITSSQPEEIVSLDDQVAIDFGSTGLYTFNVSNAFTKIHSSDTSHLTAADVDNDGTLELVTYIAGNGVYVWDNSWSGKLTNATPEEMIALGPQVAIDFGATGLYTYSTSAGFTKIHSSNTSHLAAADVDNDSSLELNAFISGNGIFIWDGGWSSQITTMQPESAIAGGSGKSFVYDFGANGIYSYTKTSGLTLVEDQDPSKIAANGSTIYCTAGSGVFMLDKSELDLVNNTLLFNLPTYGLYFYNTTNAFTQLVATQSSMAVAVDFDNDGTDEVVAFFPGHGVYTWNGSWNKISSSQPEEMISYGTLVALDFGATGLYTYNPSTGFTKIHSIDSSNLTAADVNNDGNLELMVYFPGRGIYFWNGSSWSGKISSAQPEEIIALGNQVAMDFGATGLYTYSTSAFTKIHSIDSSNLTAADVNNDGNLELMVYFPGRGIYYWNGSSWSGKISSAQPEEMTAFGNQVAMDFGATGLYTYSTSAFLKIHSIDSSDLTAADVNNDGNLELSVFFVSRGIYFWNGSIWSTKLTSAEPDFMNSARQ